MDIYFCVFRGWGNQRTSDPNEKLIYFSNVAYNLKSMNLKVSTNMLNVVKPRSFAKTKINYFAILKG